MKRLVLGLLLAGAALIARAQTPDSEFLEIYSLIQEGENLESDGQFSRALDRFQQAQHGLRQFAKSHPTWNERIVKFRLGFLEQKLGAITAQLPAAPVAAPVPVPATPVPGPGSDPAGTIAAPGVPAGNAAGPDRSEAISAELAAAQRRAESAEALASAAEARREAALRTADVATVKANEATDRASRIALELRQVRDRVEVLEASHANLERTRERLDRERTTLEARLKEALSPKAAAVDPAELTKAEERILLLVKENEVLKSCLDYQMVENRKILEKAKTALELERQLEGARSELVAQRRELEDLRGDRQKLQARLETLGRKGAERDAGLKSEIESLRRELAAARSGKGRAASADTAVDLAALREQLANQRQANEDLRRENTQLVREIEKITAIGVTPASLKVAEVPATELAATEAFRIRRLERERDQLRGELQEIRAELQRRDPAAVEVRNRQLSREVDRLQGRVTALEAKAEPYTPEELALFQAGPSVVSTEAAAGPANTRRGAESIAPSSDRTEPAPGGGEEPAPRQLAQATPPPAAAPAPASAPASTSGSAPAAAPAAAPATGGAPTNRPGAPSATAAPGASGASTNAPAVVGGSRRRTTKDLPPGAGVLAAQAQRAFAQRRYGDAEKAYREILKMDENNVFTVGNLAAILVEQGRLEDGEGMAKRALAIDPQDPFSLSLLGIVRFRQQRYDDAFDALSRSAELDPENAETQNYLGITLSQRGQRAAAEAALRKALKLSPASPIAHYNLAVVYATQKPPFLELAKYHYEKSRRAGQPANPQFEELLRGGTNASPRAPTPAPAPAPAAEASKP
jgi:tetratricopeptide (TPR) repeat protein